MPVWRNVGIVVIFYSFICLSNTEKERTSGPYRSMIVAADDCKSPSRPYAKDPLMLLETEVTNTSNTMLLSGNITVVRNAKNVKYRIKSFIWQNDKWRPNYIMNDIDCHGMLYQLMNTACGLKYDRKSCMFYKGKYFFKDLDANALQHLWASTMEYGKIIWKSETYHQQFGTYFCKEFMTVTEPV